MSAYLLGSAAAAAFTVLPAMAVFAEDADDHPAYPTATLSENGKPVEVSADNLTARMTFEKRPATDPDLGFPVIQVIAGGTEVLKADGAGGSPDSPVAEASIAEIDPGNDTREVYFSSYSGGAHCCSHVIVATKSGDSWKAVEVGDFDGDGEYLEDADGDGEAEIVVTDNRFLYRFDCYACSAAPLIVFGVKDAAVVDLSTEPRFRETHRHWLEQMEEGVDPKERWSSAGFLAGWVATRIRLGEGKEAWQELLANWDAAKDSGALACTTGAELDKCPRKNRKVLKFPERLKIFLDANGYGF